MFTFKDYYDNTVMLSFADEPFEKEPKHVWIICKFKGKWLLTAHKERGLEFPGGKVEAGEKSKEAAIREVMEETGGRVHEIHYLGQYTVSGKSATIVKNVYYAEIEELLTQSTYYETLGPVLLDELPLDVKQNEDFSFIMKDDVLTFCLERVNKVYV